MNKYNLEIVYTQNIEIKSFTKEEAEVIGANFVEFIDGLVKKIKQNSNGGWYIDEQSKQCSNN